MALDPITAGLEFGSKILDRFMPNKAASDKAKLAMADLYQKGKLAELDMFTGQMEVNAVEAAHESMFVAGWRPMVGWTCAISFAYSFVLQPFFVFLATLAGIDMTALPEISIGAMMPVLMGMLGLGWMRSNEKIAGKTSRPPL